MKVAETIMPELREQDTKTSLLLLVGRKDPLGEGDNKGCLRMIFESAKHWQAS